MSSKPVEAASLAIWLPVKRSYAREPRASAVASAPPSAFSSVAHCSPVEESIQFGEFSMLKAPPSCDASELPALSEPSVDSAPFFQ